MVITILVILSIIINEAATIKLLKPNRIGSEKLHPLNEDGLMFRKTESCQVKLKPTELQNEPNLNINKDRSNGKNLVDKANSEDLGVLMPLFDCIF